MQVVMLMDKILRNENMDLKLTPYSVMATGVDHGFNQFIPSMTLAHILSANGNSLLAYFRAMAPARQDEQLST